MIYNADRRDEERRREREFVEFPFVDTSGYLVECDRRMKDDRRSKMIVTAECISDTQFNEYFYPED